VNVDGAVLDLEGGRIVYDEYGDPQGEPVLFCHGWPSSRSMATLTHTAAADLGARIISPDRPGINGSAFRANRKLLDWPAVADALASQLRLERFRILAISGGAPYALASAWALPERVKAVAVVSGAPPIAELPDYTGLWRLHRWMLAVHARAPGLSRTLFALAKPFAATRPPLRLRRLLLKLLQPCDADVLRDTAAFEACFESSRRAWRASVAGVLADAEIYAQPWGFPLEEVRTPVHLWHGTKDRTFSYRLAEAMAERLANCRLHIVENAGHYSLPIRHMQRILRDLMRT
jgi:pimeloyl-ACP methyl ester carboxylesterase